MTPDEIAKDDLVMRVGKLLFDCLRTHGWEHTIGSVGPGAHFSRNYRIDGRSVRVTVNVD